MRLEVTADLIFCGFDKPEADFVAQETGRRAHDVGSRVKQGIQYTRLATEFVESFFTPSQVVRFFLRGGEQSGPCFGIFCRYCLSHIERLGAYFTGVIDTHETGGMFFFAFVEQYFVYSRRRTDSLRIMGACEGPQRTVYLADHVIDQGHGSLSAEMGELAPAQQMHVDVVNRLSALLVAVQYQSIARFCDALLTSCLLYTSDAADE